MPTAAAAQDLQLWQNWTQGGHKPDDLEPLLDRLDPLINTHVSVYSGRVNIPPDALQSKAEELTVDALRSFDPSKGTQLSTHVAWNLKGLNRFAVTYQNPARIPQHQVHKIQKLLTERDRYTSDFGRPPTDYVLAKKLGWTPRQVASLQKGLTRRALDPELFTLRDPRTLMPSRVQEVLSLIPAQLDPKQKFVFRGTYGLGMPEMTTTQMSRRLGVSPASISRMKKNIAGIIQQYVEAR